MSVDKVLDSSKTIINIRIKIPENGSFITKTLFMTEKRHAVKSLSHQI